LHEDLCHVRIVGPGGAAAAPGEQGQVVISNLINRASVLLNYPIGDVGIMSPKPCPCGRTFRLLSELEGRVEDIMPLADGRFVHPRAVWQVMKEDTSVLQYQLIQREPRRFSLTLVTVDEPTFRHSRERVVTALGRLLGADAVIETQWGREIHREGGGKFRAVASLCAAP